jgi:hypothetical protein
MVVAKTIPAQTRLVESLQLRETEFNRQHGLVFDSDAANDKGAILRCRRPISTTLLSAGKGMTRCRAFWIFSATAS